MDAPLSPQISLEDLATNVSLLAALSTDASGAAVSPVDSAASAAASDDAAPADDSRAPTALLIGAAEGTVPLSLAPTSMPLFHLQKRAPWSPPPPMQWGKQYRRSPALLQVLPPMPCSLTTWALPPHPSTTQRGRHGCRSPLQPQVPAGAAAASATAVGADCRGPSDRENVGISTFSD